MSGDGKPGAWVDGIGWVAWSDQLPPGTTITEPDGGEWVKPSGPYGVIHEVAIVTRWADGTTPTEPASGAGGGADLIAAERLRQVTAEGWTPEHDAEHGGGDLAMAAAAYAIHDANGCPLIARGFALWPFEPNGWKPRGQIDNLVRAGALIAAEIDRLNGTTPAAPSGQSDQHTYADGVLDAVGVVLATRPASGQGDGERCATEGCQSPSGTDLTCGYEDCGCRPAPPAATQTDLRTLPEWTDDLAAEIRRVDGNHALGAGALAEALAPWVAARAAEAAR